MHLRFILASLLLAGLAAALVYAGTSRIDAMPHTPISVDGEVHCVRLAATADHRAAGFQHVPAERMDREAILFTYDRPRRANYHMRNVAKPLQLAWIAHGGEVLRVITMQPGKSGYRSPQPVAAVLEFTRAHPLAQAVRAGTRIQIEPKEAAAAGCA